VKVRVLYTDPFDKSREYMDIDLTDITEPVDLEKLTCEIIETFSQLLNIDGDFLHLQIQEISGGTIH
jgi:hypothetical protein